VIQDEELTDSNNSLFIIQKGDCNVIVKDMINDSTEEVIARVLGPGDHFGVTIY
jgi:hypothetical protein